MITAKVAVQIAVDTRQCNEPTKKPAELVHYNNSDKIGQCNDKLTVMEAGGRFDELQKRANEVIDTITLSKKSFALFMNQRHFLPPPV